jgi:hypothetical protein
MLRHLPQARGWPAVRWARVLVACVLIFAAAPSAATAATKPYVYDLGKRSDFVAQTNLVQCVGASMQMMLNMLERGADRTATTQLRLQKLARAWSGPRLDRRERKGASVVGWAAGLNLVGAGPYVVVGTTTIEEALLTAAVAMRTTGKPVGLLMWRGRHAWVMSGFHATRDPLKGDARVTAAIVEDPLYPRDSSTWGPSPEPGAALSVKALERQFVPRRMSTFNPALAGKYVVVVPHQFRLQTQR